MASQKLKINGADHTIINPNRGTVLLCKKKGARWGKGQPVGRAHLHFLADIKKTKWVRLIRTTESKYRVPTINQWRMIYGDQAPDETATDECGAPLYDPAYIEAYKKTDGFKGKGPPKVAQPRKKKPAGEKKKKKKPTGEKKKKKKKKQ